jgi:predicted DNA binding CopG/RHH family protein
LITLLAATIQALKARFASDHPWTTRMWWLHHQRGERHAMPRRIRSIPTFDSEAEERRFWESHDSTDHLDWSKAERVRLPNLRPSTTSISLRLPVSLLERIKVAAHKRDVPHQSLIKTWLAEKLDAG